MSACPKEKGDKKRDIPVADARPDPRTVVVMQLYADATGAAVEATRRAKYLASLAVRETVVLVVVGDGLVEAVLVLVKIDVYGCSDAKGSHAFFQFLFRFVGYF